MMLAVVFSIVCLFSRAVRAETSVRIEQTAVTVEIGKDGNAYLQDEMEIEFLDDASYVDLRYDTGDSMGFSLKRVEVAEGDIGSSASPQILKPSIDAGNASPLTYQAKQSGEQLDLRIFMPSEAGAHRMVRIRFLMYRSVARFPDVADFNLTLPPRSGSGGGFSMRIDNEKGLQPLRVFAYGSKGLTWTADAAGGGILLRDDGLQADESIRIRCLYPPEVAPGAPAAGDVDRLAELIAREEALSATASWSGRLRAADPTVRLVLYAAVPVLLLILDFMSPAASLLRKKRSRLHMDIGAMPPPVAGLLWQGRVTGRTVLAALCDLTAKGSLQMGETAFMRPDVNLQDGSMTDHDRFLLQWLSSRADKDGRIPFSEVFTTFGTEPASDFRHTFATFAQLLRAYSRRMGLFDRSAVSAERILAFAFSAAYTGTAAGMALLERSAASWPLLLPAGLFLILGVRARRFSPFGRRQYSAIAAFRRRIRTVARDSSATGPEAAEWNRCFPYALAVGAEKIYFRGTVRLADRPSLRGGGMLRPFGADLDADGNPADTVARFAMRIRTLIVAAMAATIHTGGRNPSDGTVNHIRI